MDQVKMDLVPEKQYYYLRNAIPADLIRYEKPALLQSQLDHNTLQAEHNNGYKRILYFLFYLSRVQGMIVDRGHQVLLMKPMQQPSST
jgi:hypothetical protein